jgi:hypothetical protein
MEKKILALSGTKVEFDTITFQDQVIKVKKRLELEDVIQLVSTYLSEYYSDSSDRSQVIFAEYGLQSTTFEVATDSAINPEDFAIVASTSLFEDVISKITNFEFVKMIIAKTIEKIERENSLEKSISKITEKVLEAVQSFSEKGIDKDMIESIQSTVKEISAMGIKEEMPVKVRKTNKKKSSNEYVQ